MAWRAGWAKLDELLCFVCAVSRLASHAVKFLGEAAFFQKLLLQLAKKLIQQVVGLVDEADQSVGGDFGRRFFDIGLIGLIGPIFGISEFSHSLSHRMVLLPDHPFVLAQKVLEVEQQLLKAGPRYAY
jgi:hypothetical protein